MKIDAVLLAAGRSLRMGQANKLLQEVEGRTLVARAADTLVASRVREVILVTGHEAAEVANSLEGLQVRLVHNPDYAQGMSTSVRAGVQALAPDSDGVVVALADMPRVSTTHIDLLLEALPAESGICVPTYRGQRGNPVVWSRGRYSDLMTLQGDQGARTLLRAWADRVHAVEMPDDGVLFDVDTREGIAEWRARAAVGWR